MVEAEAQVRRRNLLRCRASLAIFRQRDLTRALKGAEAAGQTANRVEIDKSGTIILILDSVADRPQPSSSEPNEWDEV
jgi:hypothetical protein